MTLFLNLNVFQSAYDRLLRARKANHLRHKKLDQKRQKLKDQLEARERAHKDDTLSEAEATDRLNREIERLRREGSKQLETENEILRQKIAEEIKLKVEKSLNETQVMPKIKVIKRSKTFELNEQNLRQYFSDFGEINCLVVNKNRKKALIEFIDSKQTLNLYKNRNQFQDLFEIQWIGDKPEVYEIDINFSQNETMNQSIIDSNGGQNQTFNTDYESVVLMRLKRAEERKQLIKQLEQQND